MWIGLTGYARSGKDTVASILQLYGFVKVSMGDLIKASADPVLREYLGISAFTQDPAEKEIIRQFLVWHGYHRYDYFFDKLKEACRGHSHLVNTRVFDIREAEWWVSEGGVIIEVRRPGITPAEPAEERNLKRLWDRGLIYGVINNDSDLETLASKVSALYHDLRR